MFVDLHSAWSISCSVSLTVARQLRDRPQLLRNWRPKNQQGRSRTSEKKSVSVVRFGTPKAGKRYVVLAISRRQRPCVKSKTWPTGIPSRTVYVKPYGMHIMTLRPDSFLSRNAFPPIPFLLFHPPCTRLSWAPLTSLSPHTLRGLQTLLHHTDHKGEIPGLVPQSTIFHLSDIHQQSK